MPVSYCTPETWRRLAVLERTLCQQSRENLPAPWPDDTRSDVKVNYRCNGRKLDNYSVSREVEQNSFGSDGFTAWHVQFTNKDAPVCQEHKRSLHPDPYADRVWAHVFPDKRRETAPPDVQFSQ